MGYEQTSKVNVLFVMSGRQSDDYTAKAGEWWFDGSKWSNEKPNNTTGTTATTKPGDNSTTKPSTTVDPSVLNHGTTDFREESIYFLMTARFRTKVLPKYSIVVMHVFLLFISLGKKKRIIVI
jgi:hypothetical protein